MLFVDNGQILTSAGAAAGLDLCLHMVRCDLGAAVAADSARVSVMPLERAGGQAQFIVHEAPAPDGATLEPLLRWLEDNLQRELTLRDVAEQAAMSTRTSTGTSPSRPALPRADRHHSAALAEPCPPAPRPVPAGDHRPPAQPHRAARRVRLSHHFP